MRFGVVGTGCWAREAHAAGVQRADGAELVGVWGRNPEKAGALADTLHAAPKASRADVTFSGDEGVIEAPHGSWEPARALAVAAEELIEAGTSGRSHPYDVGYGVTLSRCWSLQSI